MTSTTPAAGNATSAPATPGLKERHRAMWASGDYPQIAHDIVPELGEAVAGFAGVAAGEQVLDVAAGTGNAALAAALAGAEVTATDLTPELLDVGRARASAAGVSLAWQVADAEALPFPAAAYDVVLSAIGVMFAPFHAAAADELVRVCRPGGRIALASWTPEGFIGQMFRVLKPYAPHLPEGAQPAPLWGTEEHQRSLFGDRVEDWHLERRRLRVDAFATGAAFRDHFKATYGPTIAVYRRIASDPEQVGALDAALAELADAGLADGVMEWEYLLTRVTRR